MSGGSKQIRVGDLLNAQQKTDLKYAYGRALAFARGRLKLPLSEAEELVAAAMVRAIPRIKQFKHRPGVPFLAWFRRVLLNLLFDEHRHLKRAERLKDLARDALTPSPLPSADAAIANERAKQNRDRLINELPEDLRETFQLWVQQYEGRLDRSEAAARLGCSVTSFEAQKKRVRREMNKAMAHLGLRAEDLWSETFFEERAVPNRALEEEDGT